MDLQIAGKVALVVASTAGLGRASALALAREGVKVCVTGRSLERCEEVVDEISASGGTAVAATLDVEDTASLDAALEECRSQLGDVDILVLNGPGPNPGQPSSVDGAELNSAVARLVTPHLHLIGATLAHMRQQRWGRIIAIGSTAVVTPSEQLVLSTMGRQALTGYLKALASEIASDGITVNVVHPGRITTPRIDQLDSDQAAREGITPQEVRSRFESTIPVRRLGDPSELGAAVAFLASSQAAYITGTALRVDGGATDVM